MSGFDGRIIFEGSSDRCKQLLGDAIKRASVQRQNKNIMGLSSSIRTYDLGGGANCVIADLGHMRVMHIIAPEFGGEEDLYYLMAPDFGGAWAPGVYDVLAGFTDVPIIDAHEVTDKKGKKRKIDALRKFTPTDHTNARHPDPSYRRVRLAVEENAIFAPVGGPEVRWSEHAHCKPANYSGSMRMVVQLLMGLGKVIRPTAEQALKLKPLPFTGTHVITNEKIPMVSAFGLYQPIDEKKPTPTVRVNFDYRSFKTHGVTFDGSGVPWVVEIATRGVHAMKLYMDPVSTTKEGHKRWQEVSPELDVFLALFPGIPLGVTLPTFEEFDKQKRAGEVVELISQGEMRAFYSQVAMNTESGWCFDDLGREAHNTCYTYGLDSVIESSHYKVGINLSGERFAKWTPARQTLAGIMTTFYEYNKCRRMLEDDAKTILKIYEKDGTEAGYKAFDKFVVKPTLVGSARITIQKKGKLFHPAKRKGQPQIKFPEPVLGGLLSFDFTPGDGLRNKKVKCDSPMYVCFIDGTLEVINYAFDNTKDDKMEEASYGSTRQDCQAVGTWVNTSTGAGVKSVRGNFYSNRWDFRHTIIGASSTISTCKGTKLGADGLYRQHHPFSTGVSLETFVHFWVECETHSTDQIPSFALGVAVPFYDRCAYYFAMEGAEAPKTRSRGGSPEHYKAKRTDTWELYNFVWAWFGSVYCGPPWVDDGPLECTARWRCTGEDPNGCFDDWVCDGFWLEACPAYWRPGMPPPAHGDSMLGNWARGPMYPHVKIPTSWSESMPDTPGSWNCTVYFINSSMHGEQKVKDEAHTYEQGVTLSGWWWRASPDDAGSMAFIAAGCSCLGSPVTNMMDDMFGETKHLGGPENMHTSWSSCYTGVIE